MAIPLSQSTLDQVIKELGLNQPDGARRSSIEVATRFMVQVMGLNDPKQIASHLQGIDLAYPIESADLLPGKPVVAYRFNPQRRFATLDPFGEYFTDPGNSKHDLGIGTTDRRFVRYEVRQRVRALKSRTKTGFVPGFGAVHGGGVQYVIPRASQHLRVVHVQHAIR